MKVLDKNCSNFKGIQSHPNLTFSAKSQYICLSLDMTHISLRIAFYMNVWNGGALYDQRHRQGCAQLSELKVTV